jgi:hypothetical protein
VVKGIRLSYALERGVEWLREKMVSTTAPFTALRLGKASARHKLT